MTIKITSATFSACVVGKDGIPADNLPVIALVGRSNVGKSSLINCITGRRELARTSSLPGKTLTINYYCINEEFYLVDLPGYGYAKASKVTKQRIQNMMNEFFAESKNLKGVIQVLDVRHKPSPLDAQMQGWIRDQKLNSLAVLTKSDKLSHQQVLKMREAIAKDLKIGFSMVFSAKTAIGKEDFLDAIEKVLAGLEIKGVEGKGRKPQSQPRQNAERSRRGGAPAGGRPDQSGDRGRRPPGKPADKPGEKQSDKQTDKPADKPKVQPSTSPETPGQAPEPRPGQSRRRRWKNRKKQPET
jgi:GTP-binding protein